MQDTTIAVENAADKTIAAEQGAAPRSASVWKAVGPGILMACAAVGASHLVWATRAGAQFGWSLLGLVILANVLKYPFFLYGQRYTAATGESLLDGYRRQGMACIYLFLGINIMTGIISTAAVSMLAGALLTGYDIIPLSVPQAAVLVMAVCTAVLLLGHYSLLDTVSKIIISVLGVCTVAAVFLAWGRPTTPVPGFVSPDPWNLATLPFLVMLVGWMPAPVDLSAWSSLWMFSRERQTGHAATVRESSFDFYLGYIACAVLAVLFVALGALVMHGSGVKVASGGVGFSRQFVELYTATIGDWSYMLILTAAFITMFSTSLTVLDGYPRSLAACCAIIMGRDTRNFRKMQQFWMMVAAIGAVIVVLFFVKSLMQLLAFASIVAFLTSPVLAYINFRVMSGDNVPADMRPGLVLQLLSWAGLAFFVLLGGGYIYVTFLM